MMGVHTIAGRVNFSLHWGMSKSVLPAGYISMGELHRRVRHACGDIYTRQWLSRLANGGKIPGAEPRPPTGKQWMFRDSDDLFHWVQSPSVKSSGKKDQR